jgi:hypothetical protein
MTAPMLSSSRLRQRPVTTLLVSDARHRFLESVDTSDPVFDFEDGAYLVDIEFVKISRLDLAKQNVLDLAGAQGGFSSHEKDSSVGCASRL